MFVYHRIRYVPIPFIFRAYGTVDSKKFCPTFELLHLEYSNSEWNDKDICSNTTPPVSLCANALQK